MFDVFIEWFGQGTSFPVIAVDVLFFLAGVWIMLLHWSSAKKVLALFASLLIVSMILQFVPSILLDLLAVLLCGFSSMVLAGAVAGGCVCWLIFRIQKRKTKTQK